MGKSVLDKVAGFGSNKEYIKESKVPTTNNTHTGDTNETGLFTISFPVGEIQAGDIIKVSGLWEDTSAVNINRANIYIGSVAAGQTVYDAGTNNSKSIHAEVFIYIQSATVAKILHSSNATSSGTVTAAPPSITIDLTAILNIYIGVKLASAGDTMTVHGYTVSVIKGTAA